MDFEIAISHDKKKCEAELHRIFEASRFESGDCRVSTEVAIGARFVYLASVKKCSTDFQTCCCKVINAWVGGMRNPFRTEKLQLFLRTENPEEPEVLLGGFKSEKELLVTKKVLHCASTAFLYSNIVSENDGVFDRSLRDLKKVRNPPYNNSLPPAMELSNLPNNNFSPKSGRFFECCPLVEYDEEDESFVAVECEDCEKVRHTCCALVTKHLRLGEHREIGDITCYECDCGFRNWKIIGDIFYHVKAFVEEVVNIQIPQRGKRKCIDVENARGEAICKLEELVHNLFMIVRITKPGGFISVSGKKPIMLIIFTNVSKMVEDMEKDINQVDYGSWIIMINDTVSFFDSVEI